MSLKTMYPPQKDSPSTFLLGDISTTDTLMTVANAATLPQTMPYPLTIGIDKTVTETVIVTATNLGNNQLTITRGTPAYAWLAGSKVARVLTAKDFKDVQDNITDINTALVTAQGTIATQGTDVANLKTAVGNASSGLVKGLADEVTRAKAAETSEASRATAAEGVLTSGKVNRTELAQVITDWAYSADGTQLLVTINRYNASTQQATQYTRTLPVVSTEAMGVMTPEAYNEITALRNDVNTLTNLGGRFIGVSFATKAALTSYVVPASVKTGDFTYVLDDETKNGATTRYVRNGNTWDFTFVIDYDPVGLANATTAGIVKSSSTDGKVFVETDGTMSVVGWSNVVKTNDARLTNARTPTAHKSTHVSGGSDALTPADIGALATNGASTANTVVFSVAGTRTNVVSGETHATLFGKIMKWFTDLGTAAFKNIPASGNAAAAEVVIGSDTRLTNARTPSAHKSTHASGGSDALTPADIGALATSGASNENIVAFSVAGTRTNIVSGETHATIMGKIMRWFTDLGTAAFKNTPASGNAAATEIVLGNDGRLTDARTPSAHKSTHAKGQPDAITPADIGAVEWFSGTTTGTGSALLLAQSNFTLTDGATIHLKLHTAMTQGATLNIANTGAHAIVDILGQGVKAVSGSWITVIYNSTTTNFVLQGSGGGSTLHFGNAPGQISTAQLVQYKQKIYF